MTFSDFQSRIRWFSQTLKSIPFIHRLPGLSSVMAAMFGDVWRDYGGHLDDALKDELDRIRGRGPPPDDPPSFNPRS